MKRLLTILLFGFLCPVINAEILEKPDTLEILYVHTSLGQQMLSGDANNQPDSWYFKHAIQHHLADSIGWPIKVYDHRTNVQASHPMSGWRSSEVDTTAAKEYWLGLRPPFLFDFGGWNLAMAHIDSFWSEALDTTTNKGRCLLPYNLPDSTADPDTTYASTNNSVLWWEVAYQHWAACADSAEMAPHKASCQLFKDSAAVYTDQIFVLAVGNPLNYLEESYPPDSADNWNSYSLNIWIKNLQDLNNQPNFYVFSMYDALVESDSAAENFGCLANEYIQEGSPTNSHPNVTGNGVLQDSAYSYTAKMIRTITKYWNKEKRHIGGRIR